jgi:hypothetical protein
MDHWPEATAAPRARQLETKSKGFKVKSSENLADHILPTSATMVGVCMTVISIVKLSKRAGISNYIDEILAIDSAIFLLSVFLSYLSLRSAGLTRRLEAFADNTFIIGLALMVISGFALSFELF